MRNIIIRNFETALLAEDPELAESLMDFVIVGGGPTGVELAGALAELKTHVFPTDYRELELDNMTITLVESGGRLLNGMSEQASRKALEYLEKMSVKVCLNCAVKSYDGHEITLSSGGKLISRTMIWAAGVTGKPVSGISAETLGRSGRIRVDEFNRVIGYQNIFAIGDAAIMEGDPGFPGGHPQMAPPAQQQGRLVAENIKRLIGKKQMKPFRYRHKGSMATIGRNKAVVDLGALKFQGFFAWLVWMFVHLLSIIGFKNKLFVFVSWMLSYLSYDKSNRLIIARPQDGVN